MVPAGNLLVSRHAPRLALVALIALVALALLAAASRAPSDWELEAPAPVIPLNPARVEGVEALGCGECHAQETEEWAGTAHAIAWVDEHYREDIADRKRPELCHGCHIPEPLSASPKPGKPPRARDESAEPLHFGITCNTCHLGADGSMLGPHGDQTDAHATTRSDRMTTPGSNVLCSSCHSTNIGPVVGIAKDFKKAGLAERGMSCVECHFQLLDGAGPNGRSKRSHALQTPRDPAFLKRAFEVAARVEGGRTIVTIANMAGHRVPGLQGREIEFNARVLDGAGGELASAEMVFDVRKFLPVDGTREIALDAVGTAVQLVGRHLDPRADDPMTFLDQRLTPEQ